VIDKEKFMKKYNIDNCEYEESNLKWNILESIYNDYKEKIEKYRINEGNVFNILNSFDKVHSISTRVKDPEHLIEKIIRKTLKKEDLNFTLQNYEEYITDLVGMRVLHLFKEDWIEIHKQIVKTWETNETPQVNIKKGDSEKIYTDKGCEINVHQFGYRSVHYLISNNFGKEKKIIVEIQVRTLFEEAWSEIDHKIRYPYNLDNTILAGYLKMFSGLAGNIDIMGSYVLELKKQLDMKNNHIKELEEEINKSDLKDETKEHIKSELKSLNIYDGIINSLGEVTSSIDDIKLTGQDSSHEIINPLGEITSTINDIKLTGQDSSDIISNNLNLNVNDNYIESITRNSIPKKNTIEEDSQKKELNNNDLNDKELIAKIINKN